MDYETGNHQGLHDRQGKPSGLPDGSEGLRGHLRTRNLIRYPHPPFHLKAWLPASQKATGQLKQEDKNMEGKIEERSLPVTLTDKETLEKAKELAKAQEDVASLEDQAKSAAATFKDKTTMTKATINILSRAISNGYEYRAVRCRWDYEWAAGVKKLVRLDTLEIVRTDAIQEGERRTQEAAGTD
jgi:hypothetical protein